MLQAGVLHTLSGYNGQMAKFRLVKNPVWVTPGGSAIHHAPAAWAGYQSRHQKAQLPAMAAREADLENQGDLAPGWSVVGAVSRSKTGGEPYHIYKLSYMGKDTGKYALDMRKAALLSWTVDPVTGRRKRGGRARENPYAGVNGRGPVPTSVLAAVVAASDAQLERWAQGPSYYDAMALEAAESSAQFRYLNRKIGEDQVRAEVAKRELARRARRAESTYARKHVLTSDEQEEIRLEQDLRAARRAKKNPIPFQEPTFGDNFHMRGATGYSQYADGRKSAHMASFDKEGVTQALATFLVLEGAGNLRRSTLVPTPQDKTIVVDVPGGRRFVASVTPYDDIAIKELVDAQGRPPYSHAFLSWGKWVQEEKYPATDWFRSVPLKNPGRAQYIEFARAAKAKGKTPAQVKKAYADKKAAASPMAVRKAAIAAEKEIFALMASIAGEEQTRQSIGTHYTFDYKEGKLDLDLPSPEYTHWNVGDPKVVKGIKAIAKKYAPKHVKISVAVSNPRF